MKYLLFGGGNKDYDNICMEGVSKSFLGAFDSIEEAKEAIKQPEHEDISDTEICSFDGQELKCVRWGMYECKINLTIEGYDTSERIKTGDYVWDDEQQEFDIKLTLDEIPSLPIQDNGIPFNWEIKKEQDKHYIHTENHRYAFENHAIASRNGTGMPSFHRELNPLILPIFPNGDKVDNVYVQQAIQGEMRYKIIEIAIAKYKAMKEHKS